MVSTILTFIITFQVSWLRHDNLHIISAGRYTYTADDRFKAVYHEETSEWLLRISNAQMRDEGVYECQVSTQPVRSLFVNLRVVGKLEPYDILIFERFFYSK